MLPICKEPPTIKRTTQLLVTKGVGSCGGQDWSTHPSWITGMEALDAYYRWVSEVLIPIVFQWIEDNKEAVYKGLPKDKEDDVGVVIAYAFEIVKTMPNYLRGIEKAEEFEQDKKKGAVDFSTINPVWTDITRKIKEDTKRIFDDHQNVLKDTIRRFENDDPNAQGT
jgi:hypothetical protein